jgi:hypothetical protein
MDFPLLYNLFTSRITWDVTGPALAGIITHAIRYSDKKWAAWLPADAPMQLIGMVRTFGAVLTSVSISYVWDPAGTLTIHGLTIENISTLIGLLAQSFGYQLGTEKILGMGRKLSDAMRLIEDLRGEIATLRKTA